MTFKRCSVKGKLYGYVMNEQGNEIEDLKVIEIPTACNVFLEGDRKGCGAGIIRRE